MEDLADHLHTDGISLVCTSKFLNSWLRSTDMLMTAYSRRRDYDVAVIDVFSGRAFLWAEALAVLLSRLHRPFVLVLRGGALPEFSENHPNRVAALLMLATAVVCPSSYLLKQMKPFREDLQLIPNPICINLYDFRPRKFVSPHLIWLRSFHTIYNPTLAPRVLAKLCTEFSDARLTMIGSDKGDGSLRATTDMAKSLGVFGQIELPGGINKAHVTSWLQRGDVFLNTTSTDNQPVSVLEAMACGLCVISTNVGGIPYLLEDGSDALLVPPDDPEAMASAILRVMSDPNLAQRLSSNARQKAEQFDWSIVLPKWRALLEVVAKGTN